jgi:prepilin-type N-terminal cleavage/methylation domain-containing protein
MKLNNKGFTLIELMVVIVIIGVLASLAIPRFNQASLKAKIAEAPRVIASFESAYLAAEAEGTKVTTMSDMIIELPSSKWWVYTPTFGTNATGNTASYEAKASANIGGGVANSTLLATYNGGSFTYTGNVEKKYAPNFYR